MHTRTIPWPGYGWTDLLENESPVPHTAIYEPLPAVQKAQAA